MWTRGNKQKHRRWTSSHASVLRSRQGCSKSCNLTFLLQFCKWKQCLFSNSTNTCNKTLFRSMYLLCLFRMNFKILEWLQIWFMCSSKKYRQAFMYLQPSFNDDNVFLTTEYWQLEHNYNIDSENYSDFPSFSSTNLCFCGCMCILASHSYTTRVDSGNHHYTQFTTVIPQALHPQF